MHSASEKCHQQRFFSFEIVIKSRSKFSTNRLQSQLYRELNPLVSKFPFVMNPALSRLKIPSKELSKQSKNNFSFGAHVMPLQSDPKYPAIRCDRNHNKSNSSKQENDFSIFVKSFSIRRLISFYLMKLIVKPNVLRNFVHIRSWRS